MPIPAALRCPFRRGVPHRMLALALLPVFHTLPKERSLMSTIAIASREMLEWGAQTMHTGGGIMHVMSALLRVSAFIRRLVTTEASTIINGIQAPCPISGRACPRWGTTDTADNRTELLDRGGGMLPTATVAAVEETVTTDRLGIPTSALEALHPPPSTAKLMATEGPVVLGGEARVPIWGHTSRPKF